MSYYFLTKLVVIQHCNDVIIMSVFAPIDLFPYQKSPNFNIGVAFSKRDMYAWKSME